VSFQIELSGKFQFAIKVGVQPAPGFITIHALRYLSGVPNGDMSANLGHSPKGTNLGLESRLIGEAFMNAYDIASAINDECFRDCRYSTVIGDDFLISHDDRIIHGETLHERFYRPPGPADREIRQSR
jgi:hypothetical protein